jgi:rubrerythrin
MQFLKKVSERVPQENLQVLLHQHLSRYEDGRPLKNIHASSLTKPEGFCPRYYALHDVLELDPKDEFLSTSEQVTFQMGRDLQDNIVHWFADMGKAVGHWKCLGCGRIHQFQQRPKVCTKCQAPNFKPEEVRFESAINGASCGIDMLFVSKSGKLVPVEIKTMDKDQFKALIAPVGEHRQRTTMYLRIIAESDHSWAKLVDTQKAKILYTTKGGFGCAAPELKGWGLHDQFSPFKQYEVTRNDKLIDDLMVRSKAVKDFRDGKAGMPCGICATALVPRAARCSLKAKCFSGDYPPENDWKQP